MCECMFECFCDALMNYGLVITLVYCLGLSHWSHRFYYNQTANRQFTSPHTSPHRRTADALLEGSLERLRSNRTDLLPIGNTETALSTESPLNQRVHLCIRKLRCTRWFIRSCCSCSLVMACTTNMAFTMILCHSFGTLYGIGYGTIVCY